MQRTAEERAGAAKRTIVSARRRDSGPAPATAAAAAATAAAPLAPATTSSISPPGTAGGPQGAMTSQGAVTSHPKSTPSARAPDGPGTPWGSPGAPGGVGGGGAPGVPLPSAQECARRGADTAACEMLKVKQRRAHRGLAGMLPLPVVLVAGALGGGYAVSAGEVLCPVCRTV